MNLYSYYHCYIDLEKSRSHCFIPQPPCHQGKQGVTIRQRDSNSELLKISCHDYKHIEVEELHDK